MTLARAHPSRIRFGPFELDNTTGELRKTGILVKLQPQPLRVLSLLAERAGQIVSREEIQRTLWNGDTFVDFDRSINFCVNQIRVALKDDAEKPRYIETLPRRGYRFIASVTESSVESAAPSGSAIIPNLSRRQANEPGPDVPHFPELSAVPNRRQMPQPFQWVFIGALLLAMLGIGLFWSARHVPATSRETRLTQLTANSVENPVTSSAISPDGKYLAFTDNAMRMRVKVLSTGETKTIPEPESVKNSSLAWTIVAWFPDGTRFLANTRKPYIVSLFLNRSKFQINSRPTRISSGSPLICETGIWIVSMLGKAPQKLRDDADAFSISPDGSSIAFGTNPGQLGDREIWLMDAEGQRARKLYDASDGTAIAGFNWSRDEQRAIYFEFGISSGELLSRDLKGGTPKTLVQFSDHEDLIDFILLPDGRLVFAQGEGSGSPSCNFWELRVDLRNGKRVGTPRQLTNWTGSCVEGMSVTSDGGSLAFHRWARQTTVNVADLEENGTRLSSRRRLTLNEYVNAAETWTPDSTALVFRSHRDGHLKLFKQALNSDTEEPLVMGAESVAGAAISPDGSWLFYLDCRIAVSECDGQVPLMRIPVQGGTPQAVLTADTYGRPRCAVFSSKVCAIAEQSEDGKPLIFTAFDAEKGRGAEIARFETEPDARYTWALSPDGSRIAILKNWDARIHILSLRGQASQEVTVKGGGRLAGIYWTADGTGWFTASKKQASTVLLHVDLQGKSSALWEFQGDTIAYGLPSPDGRRLAIVATDRNDNVWLMERF
jgi:eukaryotic-like serine/threonine-protein kinase